MKKLHILFFLFFLFFLYSLSYPMDMEHEGKIINSISFSGIKSFEPSLFLFKITTSVGSRLSYEQLSQDIKKLFEEELFEDIQVILETNAEGTVDLTFQVVEKPTVTSISITGNSKLTEKQIREKIEQDEFSMYSRQKIAKSIKSIKELYLEEGYSFAEITVKEDFRENNRIDLNFMIDEGEKLRISDIIFKGNTHVSSGKLKWRLKSWKRSYLLFTWLTGKDVYKVENTQEDVDKIKEIYQDRGYLRVAVKEPSVEIVKKGKKRRVVLTYYIEEGEKYNINTIDIEGTEKIKEESILPLINIEERSIYNGSLVNSAIEDIQKYYQNRGYIYARIYPDMDIDDENRLVNITFDITEGEQIFIRRITFVGNDVTKDKVIRREFFLREGDLFSIDPFIEGIKKLNYIGYFSEVEPNVIEVEGEDNKVDLEIKVKEQGKNQIEFGGGYSTSDKIYFHGGFMTKNLLGTGLDVGISMSTGERTKTYNFKITDPWFFDYPLYAEFEVFRKKIEYIGYQNLTKGSGFGFGKSIYRWTNLYFSYSFDRSRITDINMSYFYDSDEKIPPPPEEDTEFFGLWIGKRNTSQIMLSLVNDRRNAQINASRGSRNAVYASLAGGILAGDNKYYSLTYDSIYFLQLFDPVFVGLHGKISYIKPYGGSFLPTTKKLYLGGDYSMRGFRSRSIGPKNERGVVIGGNKSLLFNIELTIPFTEIFWIVLFYDIGNVWDEHSDYSLDDLRDSAGVELRITIPAIYLPIRFIYAWNLNPLEDEEEKDFIFGFGTTF